MPTALEFIERIQTQTLKTKDGMMPIIRASSQFPFHIQSLTPTQGPAKWVTFQRMVSRSNVAIMLKSGMSIWRKRAWRVLVLEEELVDCRWAPEDFPDARIREADRGYDVGEIPSALEAADVALAPSAASEPTNDT